MKTRKKETLALIASLFILAFLLAFLTRGGFKTVVWLLGVTAVTWTAGLLLETQNRRRKAIPKEDKNGASRIKRRKKRIVAAAALLCFGLLYVMKYWDFTVELLPHSLGGKLPRWDFLMPLGLSFFTFQSMGYVIDVYRGKYEAQANAAKYALFVSFFPQMVQGPIGRYDALAPQLLAERSLDCRNVKFGIQLAMWGYFKKLVIADPASGHMKYAISSCKSLGRNSISDRPRRSAVVQTP